MSAVTTIPMWGPMCESGKVEIVNQVTTNTTDTNYSATAPLNAKNQNQWCHVVDTETFGKRSFLSGVSTLGGSAFYHLNVIKPISKASHTMNFFMNFDAMLIMDITTKQVSWKI